MTDKEGNQKYLFVLSPPYCGSTLLWKILGTSPAVSSLPREGQCVEGVDHVMPGTTLLENPDYEVPWEYVREKWKLKWDMSKPILLEKSPSNIHRALEIQNRFVPASFIALIRDPYAFCEGCTRRKQDYDHAKSAQFWVRCAKSQRRNLSELERAILVRYEQLTEETGEVLSSIESFMPGLGQLDAQKIGSTKTALGRQAEIRNVNGVKIGRLNARDIHQINEVIGQNRELLSFFGYDIRKEKDHPVLKAWRNGAATNCIRGMRWLGRKGIVSKSLVGKVESIILG